MGWFYILKNESTGRYYTGSTNNLKERLKQHRRGHTRTTKILGAYRLVYWEKYDNINDARKREKYLKGGNGRSDMKIQLKDTFKKLGYKY